MKSNNFILGFNKIAGLPQWLHDSCKGAIKAPLKGHSKRGLKGMMERRGIK